MRLGLRLRFAGCALAAAALARPPQARPEISRQALARVGVHARAGDRAPLGLAFRDQDGRGVTLGGALGGLPGFLVFEDFRCRTLCGPALAIVAGGVAQSGLKPGHDFRLVSIGLNPRETPADARAFEAARLPADPVLARNSVFLTGAAPAIAAATAALGYGYAYDPATDQFTHPVAAFVLAPDGRLVRVLPETALTGPDLRAAIKGADRGEGGDLADRLAILCHDLIPLAGRNDAAVQAGLRTAAVATLLVMVGGFAALLRRGRAT